MAARILSIVRPHLASHGELASALRSEPAMLHAWPRIGLPPKYKEPVQRRLLYTVHSFHSQRSAIRHWQQPRPLNGANIGVLGVRRLLGTAHIVRAEKRETETEEIRPKPQLSVPDHRERVLTIPNALTMARILSAPYIGYLIVQQDYGLALAGCVVLGLTDALDGYIARKYSMQSFVGSIIDPAADKALMTTLTLALAYGGLLPTPLAVVIIGRDVALSLAAFFIRWATLPGPKTLKRYFDLSIPSVEVRPTAISKWNTALQLVLMGATLASPVFGVPASFVGLVGLQWLTGATTVISGLGYLNSKDAVHRLTKAEVAKRLPKPPVLPKRK